MQNENKTKRTGCGVGVLSCTLRSDKTEPEILFKRIWKGQFNLNIAKHDILFLIIFFNEYIICLFSNSAKAVEHRQDLLQVVPDFQYKFPNMSSEKLNSYVVRNVLVVRAIHDDRDFHLGHLIVVVIVVVVVLKRGGCWHGHHWIRKCHL